MSAAAAAAIIVGLGTTAYSAYQSDQAKKEIENSPKYNIPNEVYQNHAIAMNQAINGLPSATKNYAETNINNKLAYANESAHDLHSGVVGVAEANNTANNSQLQLDVANGNAQLEGWDKVMASNNAIGDQKGLSYQLNDLNPYLARVKEQQVANQNYFNDAQLGVGTGLSLYNADQKKDKNPTDYSSALNDPNSILNNKSLYR